MEKHLLPAEIIFITPADLELGDHGLEWLEEKQGKLNIPRTENEHRLIL